MYPTLDTSLLEITALTALTWENIAPSSTHPVSRCRLPHLRLDALALHIHPARNIPVRDFGVHRLRIGEHVLLVATYFVAYRGRAIKIYDSRFFGLLRRLALAHFVR